MENVAFRRHSRETKDLILKMLNKHPDRRITPEQALRHKYFIINKHAKEPKMKQAPVLTQAQIDEDSEYKSHASVERSHRSMNAQY